MEILIIGGTKFLGRAYSEEIVKQGHKLTLFNRGQTDPDFMPEVETIVGDRTTDLNKLDGRTWDVVIDPSGYVPRIVKQSVDALKDKVKYYVFISTISVYKETEEFGIDENAPVGELEDETVEEINGETYGPLKVLCENVVKDAFAENAIIIRPGLIVGPHDPTNRFTYWLTRIRKGGVVLAPGNGSMPSQFVHARDIARFTMKLLENERTGVFNVTGPNQPVPLNELFEEIKSVTRSDAEFKWAPDKWLTENEVGPWMEMPLWIPTLAGAALMSVSIEAAVKEGLEFIPTSDIINETLSWFDEINGTEKEWPAGLSPEKESELLSQLNN